MTIHIIILISVVAFSRFFTSQYAASHDLTAEPVPAITTFGAFASFSVLLFFAAYRTDYIDTVLYIGNYHASEAGLGAAFEKLKSGFDDSGGYYALVAIIKMIFGDSAVMYLLTIALISIKGYITLFQNYSHDFFYTALFFMCTMEYTWLMNGLKQACAIAVVLIFSKAFLEKNTSKFLLSVGIAYLFHPSAVIWIPVYFFVHEKPWTRKMILFIIGLVMAVLFIDLFTNVLDSALEGTSYDGYTKDFDKENGVNIIRVAFYAVPAVLAFMFRDKIEEEAPQYIKVCVNLSVATAGIYLIAAFTSGILVGRLPGYFTAFNWVLLAWMYKHCFINENSIYKTVLTVVYIVYFMYNMLYTGNGYYVSSTLGITMNNGMTG